LHATNKKKAERALKEKEIEKLLETIFNINTKYKVLTENSTRQFIHQLARRERVSPEKIQEILTTAFRDSYCRNGNEEADLHFDFNHDLLVYRRYQIVDQVTNPQKEITQNSELLKKGKVKNNVFFYPLNTRNFSFAASQTIKKYFARNLEKVKKEKAHEFYSPLQGQIVTGNLRNIERDYYVIDLGKGYEKIEEEPTGARIILTRDNELFLRKVLALEIPEIKEGIIIIRDILRFPNFITKIIIESQNSYLNAVGACLGKDGSRKQSIEQTIYPERIGIIKWTKNPKKLLFDLLAPIKIIRLVEEGDNWEVTLTNPLWENWQEILQVISKYLGKNIVGQIWKGKEKIENYGKIVKIVAEDIQVVEEIR
ncbi:22301_t:CDS:2, partial [Gigaspora margarita]